MTANKEIHSLKNGLRFAVDKMKDVETASVGVFVNTGSRNEAIENNGISHFLEHMAFKGTKTRNAVQIAEEFDNIGGKINAYTSREKTVYYAKVLKQDVEFATEFLSDILQNSVFDKEELEKERGVILQEIAMTNDTPDDIVFDYFQETAFPNQALGRSILGPEDNIKKFDRSFFTNYVDDQYNYSNISVSIAGNVDEEKFGSYVEKYFNNLGSKTIQNPESGTYQGGDFRKEKDLEQINLLLGFEGISYSDNIAYYKSQILASILGGGMSSRLFQEVREKRGLAYSVYAFNQASFDSGIFGIYAGTTPEKTNELITVVCDEILKITKQVTEVELKRAVTQVKADLLMASESTSSRMQKIGSNILTHGRIIPESEIIEKISAITKKDLSDLAEKIFSNSKMTFSAIGKTKDILDYQKICQKFE